MPVPPRRIKLEPNTDILGLIDEVRSDKSPRVLEREGEPIAAIVSMEDLAKIVTFTPSDEGIAVALRVGGAWKELDTDALVERIYRARHESPPSAPVRL
jgi:hypothetical protein